MTAPHDSAGLRYLDRAGELLTRLRTEQFDNIRAAARLVAAALADHRPLHIFGTGHSHMLAEEAFYRAGGLVEVSPILFEGLMLHADAPLSTTLERLPGLARALLENHPMSAGDVLLIASNSGANAVTVEMARLAAQAGVAVIAVTSLAHATSTEARQTSDTDRVHDYAAVLIDNGGAPGDAAVTVAGVPEALGPTSTVTGAAIINAIVCEAAEILAASNRAPHVFRSANIAAGDEHNQPWLTEVRP